MSAWGPLEERFGGEAPQRRLLALDGGGVRGVLTLRVLRQLEAAVRERTGDDTRVLADWFDYIAGTSSGAMIAAGLALGMDVDTLERHYHALVRTFLTPSPVWRKYRGWYDDGPISVALRDAYGADTTLEPEHLRCLLLIVTQNATTNSAWPVSSNPLARYNDRRHPDCNLRLPLWRLVRASTAVPLYFPPEVVDLGGREFVFVDGGTTPYNNPACLLFRMATAPEYRLGWPTGEERLLLVSVGTGAVSSPGPGADDPDQAPWDTAQQAVRQVLEQTLIEQDVLCRTFGRCIHGAPIDRELGQMMAEGGPPRAFRYVRYQARLDGLTAKETSVDALAGIERLVDAGDTLAREVSAGHLVGF